MPVCSLQFTYPFLFKKHLNMACMFYSITMQSGTIIDADSSSPGAFHMKRLALLLPRIDCITASANRCSVHRLKKTCRGGRHGAQLAEQGSGKPRSSTTPSPCHVPMMHARRR